MSQIPVGSRVKISVPFHDAEAAGAPLADPTEVTCRVRAPSGTITVYTLSGGDVVRASVGTYYLHLTLSAPNKWTVRWEGSGAIVAVSPDVEIEVARSALVP